eukprot:gene13812-15257_t
MEKGNAPSVLVLIHSIPAHAELCIWTSKPRPGHAQERLSNLTSKVASGYAIIIFVLLFWLSAVIKCQDDEQKGHFQVHNEKEGELQIHATKEIAKVQTQGSSVQVVLEPGIARIPIVKHHDAKDEHVQKIIHIESPVYLNGLRRNLLNKVGKSTDESQKNRVSKALMQGKKTFENSLMLEHWRSQNRNIIHKNASRRQKTYTRNRKFIVKDVRRTSVAPANRKSQINREMRVHGQTGGLKIKTGMHGTKLVSHGGYLNVFIRNPDTTQEEEKKNKNNKDGDPERRSPLSDSSNYHLINPDVEGISLKRDSLSGVKKI